MELPFTDFHEALLNLSTDPDALFPLCDRLTELGYRVHGIDGDKLLYSSGQINASLFVVQRTTPNLVVCHEFSGLDYVCSHSTYHSRVAGSDHLRVARYIESRDEYHPPSLAEMDAFLTDRGFHTLALHGVHEVVYGKRVDRGGHPLTCRVYTAIDRGSQQSRGIGKDAIRIALMGMVQGGQGPTYLMGTKRVHRLINWRANLTKRVDYFDNVEIPSCPQCGSLMRHVKGKSRPTNKAYEFWGCINYPRCRGTRDI